MTIKHIAFTAPHHAASQVGQTILAGGGTAIEAMVAAAAAIAVHYPHMNGLGGDGFWLISEPGKAPIAIDACGVAAAKADLDFFAGLAAVPSRGGKAAVTMAGAVKGWQKALAISHQWQAGLPLSTLLEPAIRQAAAGIAITQSLAKASAKTFAELAAEAHFGQFLITGKALTTGNNIVLPQLADTLRQLTARGLDDFYTGEIAARLAADLQAAGSPIALDDFHGYQAEIVTPLRVTTSKGVLFNLPAPTQGIASLLILALYDRLYQTAGTEADRVHLLIECTKQAFIARNRYVADPSRLTLDLQALLRDDNVAAMASKVDLHRASPWPAAGQQGDTVWMGACDAAGRMVSYIQSLYWEFGSGVVSPSTGIVWNNRGTSFTLKPGDLQQLAPGMKPLHTLNPAYAELNDGRRISYGTMGGEGQPQTQAAIFSRYCYHGQPLPTSVALGRWLLGPTWGAQSHNLKVEQDLAADIGGELLARGHDMLVVDACNELMGHAGAIVLDADGVTTAATDPRSDGKAFSATVLTQTNSR